MSTDYSKMSDHEINMAIARMFFPDDIVIESRSRPPSACITCSPSRWVDYCNNPADAWPIITDKRISIMFDSTMPEYEGEYHEWCDAISSCQKFGIQHQSKPLRAAMIVFLMMQDARNEK